MSRLDQSEELDFCDEEEKARAFKEFDFPRMRKCMEAVKALTDRLAPRISFSHNDLLSGNILVPTKVFSRMLVKCRLDADT